MTAAVLAVEAPDPRPREPQRAAVAQRVAALVLLASAVALVVTTDHTRLLEGIIAEKSIAAILGTGTRLDPAGPSVLVGIGGDRAFSLTIGMACSVVLVLVPFLIIAAGLLWTGRASVLRAIPAACAGVGILLTVNAARIVLIAYLTMRDGLRGYGWAHSVFGSIVIVVGLVAVVVGFVLFAARARSRKGG